MTNQLALEFHALFLATFFALVAFPLALALAVYFGRDFWHVVRQPFPRARPRWLGS
jgi:hypothetical protein